MIGKTFDGPYTETQDGDARALQNEWQGPDESREAGWQREPLASSSATSGTRRARGAAGIVEQGGAWAYAGAHEEGIPMLQFAEALFGLYAVEDGAEGQGLVEYGLIIAFIAVVVIVAMNFLRGRIGSLFSRVGNSLT